MTVTFSDLSLMRATNDRYEYQNRCRPWRHSFLWVLLPYAFSFIYAVFFKAGELGGLSPSVKIQEL